MIDEPNALRDSLCISLLGFHFNCADEADLLRLELDNAGFQGDLSAQRSTIRQQFGEGSYYDVAALLVACVDRLRSIHERMHAGDGDATELHKLVTHAAEAGFLARALWEDWARYPELSQAAVRFRHEDKTPRERTKKAREGHTKKKDKRTKSLITLCKRALRKGKGRFANGKPNGSKLAEICVDAGFLDVPFDTARRKIGKAIRSRDLV